eukprot:TRINITY_DN22295_c0_g1_i1.p1 TRINITY_DN22295_c0_g1~~TRINITY_DN22295_c0_g1_i1.p1  ORF type:complete len:282 (+),score=23.60 TRINITY_DN22295_c0_g1_i1:52-897(+)
MPWWVRPSHGICWWRCAVCFAAWVWQAHAESVPDSVVTDKDSPTEQARVPGPVHWLLAIVLAIALCVGLRRVYKTLQMVDSIALLRHVPEGMRPVECGSCQTCQYVTSSGRAFICYDCQAPNRIPLELGRLDMQELIAPTGPLRRYEFRKGGENYWQELNSEDIEEGPSTTAALAQIRQPPMVIGNQGDCENLSLHSGRSNGVLPQCVICLDSPGCMVLLPCAHGSVCEVCSTRIAQNGASGGAHCPHCRANIKTLVKIREIDADGIAMGIEYRIPMVRPR